MTPAILRESDQSVLLVGFLSSLRVGAPCAVLDPTWPDLLQKRASTMLDRAFSAGLLGSGDLVVFSSGSTGHPRGIVRRVESWEASLEPMSAVTGITGEDRVWLPGPLWSSLFLYGAFHAASTGAGVLLRGDDPDGASVVHCVPSQLPSLLKRAEAGGLPAMRLAVVAGDRLEPAVRRRCVAAGWRVLAYYGAAELSFVACRDDDGPYRAFPGAEVQVRERVLWTRSAYLARGYLAASDRGPMRRDPDGWATVGDLARTLPGGLEVLGRGDTAVTTGGHTVVVEEVEMVLRAVSGVDDVAVLGMPHPRLGEVLTAVVVGGVDDAQLRAAVAGLPAPSRPRRWFRANSLPRTDAGKVRREALADVAASLSRP